YLPPGLSLAPDGALTGTPTATGQYFFTVNASDAAGHLATNNFNVSIYAAGSAPPLSLNFGPNFGTWGIGQIETPLSATGGNGPYAWLVIAGSLPPGISIRTDSPSWFPSSASAGLSGVATTTGTFTFTLRVTSGGQTADQMCPITVVALASTENQLPDAFVATPYSYQLHAQGNAAAVTWTATNPLPAGLSLRPSGLLSGTPTTAGFGHESFSITHGLEPV